MSTTKVKALFLDRDGVIIRPRIIGGKPYPVKDVLKVEIMEGVQDFLAMSSRIYRNIVVTNQPDVARGTQTREEVEKINNFLLDYLTIDDVFTCFHDDADNCSCRKPMVGLGLLADKKYNIDFKNSWMIGDRSKDIDFGNRLGCNTILIDYSYTEPIINFADFVVPNIRVAREIILG